MSLREGMFAVKLYELEQQYGQMQSRLELCQRDDHPKIHRELQDVTNEFVEKELLLYKTAKNSRSPAAGALADAQLEYFEKIKHLLDQELPECLGGETGTPMEAQAEASALCAEYAIDFAVQSMRYALMTALKAIDMQMDYNEKGESIHE
ncbi:MAG: hypothetical protein ACOX8H_11410 [Ruminococcus sp.]|jgi:transcriptional regulator of acetoin/glycerol metabolism